MNFLPVLLWSDLLIWLLLVSALVLGALSLRNPPLRAAWRRVGASRPGMAAATLLIAFVVVGLLDSLHYRPVLEKRGDGAPQYAIEVLSLLDALVAPLRTRNEKTYSEPLATRAYAKESIELRLPDGSLQQTRDYPRLRFGGSHLADNEAARDGDLTRRVLAAAALALFLWAGIA
ncbi:MAG: ABC transporter permease, partial [Rhodocyclaceae bacterium]